MVVQYLSQAFGSHGPKKYNDMLLATGTEELAHIEMLATVAAPNLKGAPAVEQEAAAKDGVARKERTTAATGVVGALTHALTGEA